MTYGRWLHLDGTITDEQEFYWLWIVATTAYGVGDVVTTVALVFRSPGVQEGNPLVAVALAEFGIPGLVAGKLLAFFACFALSLYAARAWEDRFLYVFPPATLAVVGLVLTVTNSYLMFTTRGLAT